MTGPEVTAAMKAEDVDPGLVEKACRAVWPEAWSETDHERFEEDFYVESRDVVRHALAAVLPEVKRESHRAGYETARDDMVSGAFIGGPTYAALRDSFAGRQIAKEALERAANEAWMNRHSGASDALRRYAARLTAATGETAT